MLNYALSFCLGVSSKLTDLTGEHGWKPFPYAGHIFGIVTGLLIVYLLATTTPLIATLMLSILIGLVLVGKIDTFDHQLAVGIFLLGMPLLGIPRVDYPLLVLFTAVNILEEKVNDRIPSLKKNQKILAQVLELRPLLEITTFIVAVLLGDFSLWLMLFSYDTGYMLVSGLHPRLSKKPSVR